MADILNLALPYFGLIFIGFACGKTRGLPESGLAWMNFFLLYVSLPALLFGITSKTPFAELNNPPFLVATTLGTITAFVLAMYVSSGPVARFVAEHPTTKMLALAFLLLIGVALVADGFKFQIPRGYIYFAIVFSVAVELFNTLARRNRKRADR